VEVVAAAAANQVPVVLPVRDPLLSNLVTATTHAE
jgi:hypothetical protein